MLSVRISLVSMLTRGSNMSLKISSITAALSSRGTWLFESLFLENCFRRVAEMLWKARVRF
jgi:hypothetical protein